MIRPAPKPGANQEAPTGTRSFIVKLWQEAEDRREDGRPAVWRGQIVSVPGGERVYARGPDELPVLLAREIGRAGIRLGWTWRLRLAIHGWRRAFRRRG